MKSRSDFTGGDVPTVTRKFQVIDGGRDAGKTIRREVRQAVLAQVTVHGHGMLAVARRNGLTLNDTVRILVEELKADGRKQFHNGYLAGISRGLFPGGPGGAAVRRVA